MTRTNFFGLAALAILIALSIMGTHSAIPLYDGLCNADPYHYLNPPKNALSTSPPQSFSKTLDATASNQIVGASAGQNDTHPETPAQFQLLAEPGAIMVPPRAKQLQISIMAVPPTNPSPDGFIDGNVYRLSIQTDTGKPVELSSAASQQINVILRSPELNPKSDSTAEEYFNGSWHKLVSTPIGCQFLLSANSNRLGDFTIVSPHNPNITGSNGTAPSTSSPDNNQNSLVFIIAGALTLGVAVLLLLVLGPKRK